MRDKQDFAWAIRQMNQGWKVRQKWTEDYMSLDFLKSFYKDKAIFSYHDVFEAEWERVE